jgi:hypothetical protein
MLDVVLTRFGSGQPSQSGLLRPVTKVDKFESTRAVDF